MLHNVCVELWLLQSSRAHEADDGALRMRPPYSHSDILFLVNLPRQDLKKNLLFFSKLYKKRARCTPSPPPHRGRTELQKIGRENKRTCAEMVSSLKKSLQAVVARPTAASKKSYQSGRLFGAESPHSVRLPSRTVHFKCLQPRTSNAERYL